MEFVKEKDVLVSYNLAPEDKLIYCPYNRSHQVREFRLASHLEVCRRAYLKSSTLSTEKDRIVKCQWLPNKHHLRQSSLQAHETLCEGNNEQLFHKFQTSAFISNSSSASDSGSSGSSLASEKSKKLSVVSDTVTGTAEARKECEILSKQKMTSYATEAAGTYDDEWEN